MAGLGQAVLSDAYAAVRAAEDDLAVAVRRHARLVYCVAYSVLRNHHDAEDAAQETFMRVLRQRRPLAAIKSPRAWLARIAWRVALDKRRRAPEISLEDAAQVVRQLRASGAGAEQITERREMGELLERLIATLPRELRETVILSTIEEMSSPEIAAVLDIPEASVRTRLFRARQLLREKLSALVGGEHGR